MIPSQFAVSEITALSSLAPGLRVHVIGVCGVAMAQLAVILSSRGYRVSGSDKDFYEPMGSLLKRSSVELRQGYAAANIPDDVGLVVIGNAVTKDNPEVLETARRSLPYSIFPQVLREICIASRHSIVICGTHGKTTTTALGAYGLRSLGLDPSFFVGGMCHDFEESLHCGEGSWSVVEGDEYDSSFFAKVPKFSFYAPQTVVVTSLEFDHADIYSDLAAIEREFDKLPALLGPRGLAVCCLDDPNVARLVGRWRKLPVAPAIVSYGFSDQADFRVLSAVPTGPQQRIELRGVGGTRYEFSLAIPGAYNALNAAAILAIFEHHGLEVPQAAQALAKFRGVKRRQEVRFDGAVTLIEDFAHHPTAVRETIRGIRSRYSGRRLWAVFEPRSNTSRRKVFQHDYERAFDEASEVLLCEVQRRASDLSSDLIQVSDLSAAIAARGVPARTLPDAAAILQHLQQHLKPGDVILLMSNGSFGGLPARLTETLLASSAGAKKGT